MQIWDIDHARAQAKAGAIAQVNLHFPGGEQRQGHPETIEHPEIELLLRDGDRAWLYPAESERIVHAQANMLTSASNSGAGDNPPVHLQGYGQPRRTFDLDTGRAFDGEDIASVKLAPTHAHERTCPIICATAYDANDRALGRLPLASRWESQTDTLWPAIIADDAHVRREIHPLLPDVRTLANETAEANPKTWSVRALRATRIGPHAYALRGLTPNGTSVALITERPEGNATSRNRRERLFPDPQSALRAADQILTSPKLTGASPQHLHVDELWRGAAGPGTGLSDPALLNEKRPTRHGQLPSDYRLSRQIGNATMAPVMPTVAEPGSYETPTSFKIALRNELAHEPFDILVLNAPGHHDAGAREALGAAAATALHERHQARTERDRSLGKDRQRRRSEREEGPLRGGLRRIGAWLGERLRGARNHADTTTPQTPTANPARGARAKHWGRSENAGPTTQGRDTTTAPKQRPTSEHTR